MIPENAVVVIGDIIADGVILNRDDATPRTRSRARDRWGEWRPPGITPDVEPMFGPRPGWEPGRACPHRAMPPYSKMVCMVCHATGERTEAKAARHDLGPRPEEAKAEKPKKTYAERRHGKRETVA